MALPFPTFLHPLYTPTFFDIRSLGIHAPFVFIFRIPKTRSRWFTIPDGFYPQISGFLLHARLVPPTEILLGTYKTRLVETGYWSSGQRLSDSTPSQGHSALDDSSVPEYLVCPPHSPPAHSPHSNIFPPSPPSTVWRRPTTNPTKDSKAASPTSRPYSSSRPFEPHRCPDRQKAQTRVKGHQSLRQRRQDPERWCAWWHGRWVQETGSKVHARHRTCYTGTHSIPQQPGKRGARFSSGEEAHRISARAGNQRRVL